MKIQLTESRSYFNTSQNRSNTIKSNRSESVTISNETTNRETEFLKSKGLALAKSINNYDDEEMRLNLENQLKQIQNELRQKDNNIYRQNNNISLGIDIQV